ncbi:unnamed protein product, partial [marine sediment metagenome]
MKEKELYMFFLRKTELKDRLLAQQEEYNYLSIAIQRYNNAFLNAETRESLITYTISCLEALFLKDNERMDLKRTLSQRISIIMKIFKFNPILIYNLIDVAYKIRSKYSHGGITKRKDLDNLAKKILDLTRMSLLILIQLDAKIEKIEVIKDIRDLINIDDWNLIKKDSSLIKNRKNILL